MESPSNKENWSAKLGSQALGFNDAIFPDLLAHRYPNVARRVHRSTSRGVNTDHEIVGEPLEGQSAIEIMTDCDLAHQSGTDPGTNAIERV